MAKKRSRSSAPRRIRARGIRRAPIDETKLALAIWLLAKQIVEDRSNTSARDNASASASSTENEAAT
jgi:hypothetical protein